MRKSLILTLAIGLSALYADAQRCGFDAVHQRQLSTSPQYRQQVQLNEDAIRISLSQPDFLKPGLTLSGPQTIPVVVHVVHTGGAIGTTYNPTDAQITGAITYLNQVFDGTLPGGEGAGDMGVRFVLAQRDPGCNPTNGINRIDGSSITNYTANGVNFDNTSGTDEINIKNLIRWDPSQYYNIWVVNKIDGADGTSGTFTAGYAYFPDAPASVDGTVILATQMQDGSKTLPHELGHALMLHHPFNGATGSNGEICPANTDPLTDGDMVADTDPVTMPPNLTTRSGANPCMPGFDYGINTEHNFMNYTDRYTLFTQGQKDRVSAAMALSSRASLAASLGGTAPGEGTTTCAPSVNFEFTEQQHTEATAASADCRSFTDYTYQMLIGSAPTATTTVTLTLAGSTATESVDFDLTTNGSFTTPSKILSFPAGSAAAQAFTLRVYDDAILDDTEDVTLAFTVDDGGGNALAGTGRPNLTLTIFDNDSAPVANSTSGTANIGSLAGFDNTTLFNAQIQSQRASFLYKASELTAAGIPAGILTGLSLDLLKYSTRPFENFQIKIGTTTAEYLADNGTATVVTTSTVKTVAAYTTIDGWNDFSFDTPFNWDGTSNLVVDICYTNSTTDLGNAIDGIGLYSDGGTQNQGNLYFQDNINCSQSYTGPSPYGYGYKPVVRFNYGIPATVVQSTLNATKTEYLGPSADVFFYDQTNGHLLARVRNLSTHDYGCTQLLIDRAGTGTTPFWTNTSSQYLMNKTYRILPSNNNTSGTYEVTYYFTADEKAGWEAETGQTWSNIRMVKVPSQISNYSPSDPAPDGSGTVHTVDATQGTFGAYHTLTATFTTGFSGFGFGVVATTLPATGLTFTGAVEGGNAQLQWQTESEQDTKAFVVEKSADGQVFQAIGTVAATGNSGRLHKYQFADNKLQAVNYYRLRIVDHDGKHQLSGVIRLHAGNNTQQMWVMQNPFRHQVGLRLAKMAGTVRLQLYNEAGHLVAEQTYRNTSQLQWNLPAKVPGGPYILKALIDGKVFTQKLVKE